MKLIQTKPTVPGTMGPMGTPACSKEVGQPAFSSELPPNKRQRLRDGPKTEPWGLLLGVETGTLFSQGSERRVTYFTGVGPGHGRVGGECGEEGVAELRHEHVRVSSVSSSMGTGVFQPSRCLCQ